MLEILKAVILGIIEGITEFLPISSTGHLILVNEWIAFHEPFTALFDIVIQSGAILAVIVLFWKDLLPETWSVRGLEKKWGKLLAAFAVTAIVGLLFSDVVEEHLFSPMVVAGALFFYGVLFLWIERKNRPVARTELTYAYAILIGLVQALALVPGTSRSGATILGMLLLGFSRIQAVRTSFFLAIPTLIAASGYSLLKYKAGLSAEELSYLAVGFFVSFIVAYAISKWFLAYISKNSFVPFAWYRIALAIIVFIYLGLLR